MTLFICSISSRFDAISAAEIGGLWTASLLGVLVIGNLVGAYLLLLFRHWRRRSDHFRREAERDNLTGLYSRHKLDDVLRTPDHDSDEVAVLMIDLNGFKATNDKFGHECGDQLLQAVANLLRGCLRQCDMAFRIGGDEFLILLHHADQSTAARVTTRIEKRAARWNLANRVPGPRLSLAIGEATGLAADMDELIRQADSRMYLHKTISNGQCAQAVESDGPSLDDQRTPVSVAQTSLPDDELR